MNDKNARIHSESIRRIVVFICMLFFFNAGYSQNNDSTTLDRNTFYLDLASEGAYYSLNYDRIFHQGDKLNFSYRIGFSIFNEVVALPFGINLFTGKETHHIEFSITIMPYVEEYKSFFSQIWKISKKE